MSFTDSHAHLADERFAADCAAVLTRAREAGVERILTIAEGTRPDECEKTLALTEQHDFLWAAVGVHPHEARRATEKTFDAIEKLAQPGSLTGATRPITTGSAPTTSSPGG